MADAQSFVVLARAVKRVIPDFAGASFATVVVADPLPPVTLDRIALVVGGMTVRSDAAADARRVAELAAALRAAR
jgi:hypothetical protein